MTSKPLDDMRVVVTGAGSGLGAAYAEAAAAAGAAIVVNDLDARLATATADRITAAGGRAVPFAADVSDWSSAQALVNCCITAFSGIDGLVNNAGVVGRLRTMLEETEEVLRKILDVNVLGSMFVGVHAARAMVAGGTGGSIVNVSSGNQCGHRLLAAYGASKGAASSLTYAWAVELAEHGIRVNAISPNAHTDMIDDVIAQLGYNPEERLYPTKEDNAAVVTYLLSEDSARLNGQIVRVDHGYVSLMTHPMVSRPRVPMNEWSVATLGRVFDDELHDCVQPLGIATAEVRQVSVLH
jgi:NAD(P)-dependent dehydrogenase (short-subunit alcohol dehydrogenase family)